MKKQTAKSGASEATKAHVAFGLDEHGKPRAARFVGASPALLAKAAQAMQLQLVEIQTEAEAEASSKLPTGRLYSTGRGFVPNVRRELYTRLLEALGSKAGSGAAVTTPENVYPSSYADSEARRPPIPTEGGHPIRSKAATDSERRRPPLWIG